MWVAAGGGGSGGGSAPLGNHATALMSDSCPLKVCTEFCVRMSNTFESASHAPVTNVSSSVGRAASDITSPLCPLY